MKYILELSLLIIGLSMISCSASKNEMVNADKKMLKALILDGENNHGVWPMTTMMMKDYLEQTGMFTVDIKRTHYTWQGPHHDKVAGIDKITELIARYPLAGSKTEIVEEPVVDPNFNPAFNNYDLVISNLGWKASTWSDKTKKAFEDYMANGGGLIIVHAANNSFGDWEEFNKMIGFGGWGGRAETYGNYMYYDDKGNVHKDPSTGPCGSHGPQYEFVITTREPNHPIMKGLPAEWLHTKDELYDRMRGPAENMTVLATAYSDVERNGPPWAKDVKGTGRHEPMLSVIQYGKGRVFHTTLGHMDYSMESVGFITTLQRGAEWVATGKVTQALPSDFPSKNKSMLRTWGK
jgi:type 1 glutamine amidotransferase